MASRATPDVKAGERDPAAEPGLPARVLVVDDEEVMQDVLTSLLGGQGYQVTIASDAESGLSRLGEEDFDLVVLDLMLPGMSGLEALEAMRKADPELPVILLTAHGTVESAIDAMKAGAFDYVLKPFRNDELLLNVRRALGARRLTAENRNLRQQLRDKGGFAGMVGRSEAMEAVFAMIRQVAPSRSTVLIEGESGTGKELVARAIHAESPRAGAPFVVVNCGNLAPEVQESTLFGHVKGAFAGATTARKGLLELADGGTLFFDEVSSLAPEVQARLLRFLENKEVTRLGSAETVRLDVRLVAATNSDLPAAVEAGRFRADLLYRLKVISIRLPALGERRGDVPLLATHFLQRYGSENGKTIASFTPEALAELDSRTWPGNVRELENLVQKAVVLCQGNQIGLDLVREETPAPRPGKPRLSASGNYKDLVDEFERSVILDALRQADGVQKRAAEILGLRPTTLNEKIKRLGIRYRA